MIDCKINAMVLLTISIAFICDAKTSRCHYNLNRVKQLVAHCENQGFTLVPRNLNNTIQELDLSNNMIKTLENGTFENYSILEVLILNHNRISEVHIHAFVGLPYLKVLKIRDNFINITKLSTRVFSPLVNLTTLDIGRNAEQSPVNKSFVYPDKTFAALKRLQFLSLDLFMFPEFGDGFRSLQFITVLNFDRYEIIESTQNFSLDLNNNALVCSCTTLDFLLWLTKTPVSFVNGNTYTCTMSNNSQVNLMEVTKDIKRYFADCNATVWLRIGIVLISCIVSVSIPLSIVYYYRWKIILFMFRKFRRAVERGLHVNYEYDVYVSYEERSITWIKNNLLPKTEQEWGLKIC
ncbi:toll-like receptor 10 [Mytilus trossulus]|uniref:toll-like receptor 10 n=1 Tax=Mytilus trossulus TaxID=6551 RepID=UPI003004D396